MLVYNCKEEKLFTKNLNLKNGTKTMYFPVLGEHVCAGGSYRSSTHLVVKFFAGLFNRLYTILKSECATK